MGKACELQNNPDMRHRQYQHARNYYHRFLKSNMVLEQLREAYLKVAEQGRLATKQEFVNA
jgi:hypothetical protein